MHTRGHVAAATHFVLPLQAIISLTQPWDTELHPRLPPLQRSWVRELLLLGIHGRFLFQTQVGYNAEAEIIYALDDHVRPKYAFQEALNLVAVSTWFCPPTSPASPVRK